MYDTGDSLHAVYCPCPIPIGQYGGLENKNVLAPFNRSRVASYAIIMCRIILMTGQTSMLENDTGIYPSRNLMLLCIPAASPTAD